jgi:uncharacterized BrkB/YihY/UPF0761 family membrane protein
MIFAGLITLFLQRSSEQQPRDNIVDYIPAALGCAIANYLGNNDQQIFAILVIIAILCYIWYVLKPLRPST